MSYTQYVPYTPAENRYDTMPYRRCGKSGLKLPAISLGLWHNFGDITPFGVQQQILRTAFDNGITHFDLANNYGPPYGFALFYPIVLLLNNHSCRTTTTSEHLYTKKMGYIG